MAEHYFTGEPTSRHEARTVCVQAGGRALAFETDAGTFSKTRLDPGSRLLFVLAAATAIAVMPLDYQLATAALVLLRYGVVFAEIWRITRRLGERGLRGAYFVYDLLSPFYEMLVALLCLRRDDRVWR